MRGASATKQSRPARRPPALNPLAHTRDQLGIYVPYGVRPPLRNLRKPFPMSPTLITGFFLVLGLYSLWGIINELRTGIAKGGRATIDVRENAGGFYLLIFTKSAFVCFVVAIILNAFGLIGDPFIWAHTYLPFLMPK